MGFSTWFCAFNCTSSSEFHSVWKSQCCIFDFAESNNNEIQKFQEFVEYNQLFCFFDIINIANHCKNFGVKQSIVSDLTLTTRLNASFIYQLNNSNKVLCQKHGYRFIDNSNISSENLWQDGLHLNNSGKSILLKYYAVTLNDNYFLSPSFTQ